MREVKSIKGRHCERSEAIQSLFSFYLDRRAALRLAMTMLQLGAP